jgi:hypothetical protein
MDKKVILLNGPPGSGKDLSGIIIRNMLFGKRPNGRADLPTYKPVLMKFADPLKQAAHALFGIPFSCEHYEKEHGHDWKNQPQVEFYGRKPRDVYIDLSEQFVKPRFDSSFFGKVAFRTVKLDKQNNVFIFTDSGFVEEAVPIVKAFGVDNVLVVELARSGASFDGDSRSYVGAELSARFNNQIKHVRIPNDGDQEFLTALLKGLMMKHLGVEVTL